MSTLNSSWKTHKGLGWARREEGDLTLVEHRGVFLLLSHEILPIQAADLTEAISFADRKLPPAGWSYVVGMWIRPGWKIQKSGEGWKVHGEDGEPKSQKTFERADMARKWCEIRNDRVGMNLRGPKPKTAEESVSDSEE